MIRTAAVLSGLYALLACGLTVYALNLTYESWQAGGPVFIGVVVSMGCLIAALRSGRRAARLWKEGSKG